MTIADIKKEWDEVEKKEGKRGQDRLVAEAVGYAYLNPYPTTNLNDAAEAMDQAGIEGWIIRKDPKGFLTFIWDTTPDTDGIEGIYFPTEASARAFAARAFAIMDKQKNE